MNPLEEYISIIHNRQQDPLPENVYGEKHHIIPRACGGCNKKWNIVRLTAQEHYRCHCLLPLIYTTGEEHKKMVFAWKVITNTHTTSPEQYAAFREEHAKLMSEVLKGRNTWTKGRPKPLAWRESRRGEGNSFYGKHHSDETRKRMSEARKGKTHPGYIKGMHWTLDAECRKRRSEKMKAYWATKRTNN